MRHEIWGIKSFRGRNTFWKLDSKFGDSFLSITSSLWRLRQGDGEFDSSLGYIVSALVSKARVNQTGIGCQGQNHGHGKQMAVGGSLELLDLAGHMRDDGEGVGDEDGEVVASL